MKMQSFLFGAMFLSITFTTQASACSCKEYETIEEHIENYDVIFFGTSTGTRVDVVDPVKINYGRKTEFYVIRNIKGDNAEKIEIFHAKDTGGNCGIDFYEGANYLVFANKSDDGVIKTSYCSGTRQELHKPKWTLPEYLISVGEY